MADKKDKKSKSGEKSTAQILSDSRNVLYGDSTDISLLMNNMLTLMNRMDTRLTNIEKNTSKNTTTLSQMNDKLTSLTARVITAEKDIVDVKSRVTELETNSLGTGNLFDEIKRKSDDMQKSFVELKKSHSEVDTIRQDINEHIQKLEQENEALHEKFIDMQCRSMKYNLIFTGLDEQNNENLDDKLRRFLYYEMGIEQQIEFGNMHRFGKRNNHRPRPIIARFLYYADLDMVKKAGYKLQGTQFGVNEQFPLEIEQKRRRLYPIMKEEKKKKSKVVLIRDKLYVNDELVNPDDYPREPHQNQSTTRPKKRPRVNSTPERDDTSDYRQ